MPMATTIARRGLTNGTFINTETSEFEKKWERGDQALKKPIGPPAEASASYPSRTRLG